MGRTPPALLTQKDKTMITDTLIENAIEVRSLISDNIWNEDYPEEGLFQALELITKGLVSTGWTAPSRTGSTGRTKKGHRIVVSCDTKGVFRYFDYTLGEEVFRKSASGITFDS